MCPWVIKCLLRLALRALPGLQRLQARIRGFINIDRKCTSISLQRNYVRTKHTGTHAHVYTHTTISVDLLPGCMSLPENLRYSRGNGVLV